MTISLLYDILKLGGKSLYRHFGFQFIMKWGENMQGTFDALIPPEQETVTDPSVTPDATNNMDLAAIVQRLDELTEKVQQLSAVVEKTNTSETETKSETETIETETKNESEE